MVFNGVAGGQSIMCLSLQRRCRWFGFFRVGCACDVAGFLGVTGGGGCLSVHPCFCFGFLMLQPGT